jgi:hypothetical protein
MTARMDNLVTIVPGASARVLKTPSLVKTGIWRKLSVVRHGDIGYQGSDICTSRAGRC